VNWYGLSIRYFASIHSRHFDCIACSVPLELNVHLVLVPGTETQKHKRRLPGINYNITYPLTTTGTDQYPVPTSKELSHNQEHRQQEQQQQEHTIDKEMDIGEGDGQDYDDVVVVDHHDVYATTASTTNDRHHGGKDENVQDSKACQEVMTMPVGNCSSCCCSSSSSNVVVQDTDDTPTFTNDNNNHHHHYYTCIANPAVVYDNEHRNNDDDSDCYDETQSREEVFDADGTCMCIQSVSSSTQNKNDRHCSDDEYKTQPLDDKDAHNNNNMMMTMDPPLDFHSLAQQALQSLDSEYFKTVMSREDGDVEHCSSRTMNDVGNNASCCGGVDNFDNDNGEVVAVVVGDSDKNENGDDAPLSQHNQEDTDESPAMESLLTIKTQVPTNTKIDIDTATISKVMKNISLSSCGRDGSNSGGGGGGGGGNVSIQEKYLKWKPSHCSYTPFLVPTIHPLIPPKALLAFQRFSKKAKLATANLTRSATIAEAISRIYLSKNKTQESERDRGEDDWWTWKKKKDDVSMDEKNVNHDDNDDTTVFVIHCIGADRVECQTRENIVKMFQPIVKWIHGYGFGYRNGYGHGLDLFENENIQENSALCSSSSSCLEQARHLRIELLGPNVPLHSEDFGNMNLLPSTHNIPGKLMSATLICKNCMYHDYIEKMTITNEKNQTQTRRYPNMIIAYNAGIWGYTDWHPTLKSLYKLTKPVPFVITAYTIYEAEDDAHVLDEVLREEWNTSTKSCTSSRNNGMIGMDGKRCLWGAELNPYASRVIRETKSSDNIYHENGAWQAYLMGKITDD
jgi:hypothetical protein